MKKKLPILQSGFLSLTENGLTKVLPPSEESVIRAIELGKPFDADGNPFFFNQDIDELFEKFNADHRLLRSFEFREEFLRAIKQAFSAYSLQSWFDYQVESPYLTGLHRRFLNDTLNFIYEGKRDIRVESWLGLIYASPAKNSDCEPTLDPKKYFGNPTVLPLGEIIASWTSHPEGWNDLFYFVAIVFSNQTSKTV